MQKQNKDLHSSLHSFISLLHFHFYWERERIKICWIESIAITNWWNYGIQFSFCISQRWIVFLFAAVPERLRVVCIFKLFFCYSKRENPPCCAFLCVVVVVRFADPKWWPAVNALALPLQVRLLLCLYFVVYLFCVRFVCVVSRRHEQNIIFIYITIVVSYRNINHCAVADLPPLPRPSKTQPLPPALSGVKCASFDYIYIVMSLSLSFSWRCVCARAYWKERRFEMCCVFVCLRGDAMWK